MTNLRKTMANNIPVIRFDEWLSKKKIRCKVILKNFDQPSDLRYKDTVYYTFQGYFKEYSEMFRIQPMRRVIFHFSKQSYEKELVRHIDLTKLDDGIKYEAEIEIGRPNKNSLVFYSFTYKQTDIHD